MASSDRPARAVWVVARHESRRLVKPFLHRRTLYGAVAVAIVLALVWPLVAQRGIEPQRALYPVGLSPGSPFAPVVASDGRFDVVANAQQANLGDTIVLWIDDQPHQDGSVRGRAAVEALRLATQAWLDNVMAAEAHPELAFPVTVDVNTAPANAVSAATTTSPATSQSGTSQSPTSGLPGPPTATQPPSLPGAQVQSAVRPSQVQPPFPVRSLLLTFAYLIPMNFIGQLYAGSLLAERIRHRGLLMLTAPVGHGTVLAGRSLPYVGLGVGVLILASLLIGAGPIGFLGAIPIIAFALASSLLLGLLARSERELTFLLTGTTTMFSTFLFLPAVFTAIPPIAFLSPVAVVSASIQHQSVGWGPFLYATLPISLSAVALALLARALYREETLFSPMRLGRKLRTGLAVCAQTRGGLVATGILLVPFALALEMFVLAFVIPLGLAAAFPVFVLGAAFVEEALKRMASRAHRQRKSDRPAWQTGLLVGSGFFVGEKLALLVALVGFSSLPLGQESLGVIGGGSGLLLVAPLVLHTGAAMVGALAPASRRPWGTLALGGAWALHASYNAAILVVGA